MALITEFTLIDDDIVDSSDFIDQRLVEDTWIDPQTNVGEPTIPIFINYYRQQD